MSLGNSRQATTAIGIPRQRRSTVTLCVTLFLALALAQTASAADMTFDPIPVSVQGLINLTGQGQGLFVQCRVAGASGQYFTTVPTSGGTNPNFATPDASGNFSGNLSYALNFPNKADMANAKSYFCFLSGNNGHESQALKIGDGSQWYHVKSGTVSVSGTIP